MSKKSRHNTERRNRLAAARAELLLTLEDKAEPHHMTYNARKTEQLINEYKRSGMLPYWAVNAQEGWRYDDPTKWATDQMDAVSYGMVYGSSITKTVMPST